MSKGNMLLGHARGKVGDLVFARVNGEQVTRARAAQVKNPQTEAQMIQRILLNTIAQAYSKMSAICDHSFEGVQSGQASMSYFMRRNLSLIRATLAEIGDFDASAPMTSPIGSNGLASNTYVVSKGQLAEIIPTVGTGGVSIALSANTYAAVCAATGLQRGDQLTIITVSGSSYTDQKFHYSRIILDPRNLDGTEASMESTFISGSAVNLPNPRNENTGHTYAFSNGAFDVSVAGQNINMGAAIGSRLKSDGSWLRSNAALILADGASIGYTMQESLDLFAAGGLDVENPMYLNNAVRNAARSAARATVTFSTKATPAVTITAVGIEQTVNGDHPVVKVIDDQGNKYFVQNHEDDSPSYGKYMNDKDAGSLDELFALANIGEGPTDANTVYLESYLDGQETGTAQVNWFASMGIQLVAFYRQQ